MKRISTLLALGASAAMVLSGCGGNDSSDSADGTTTIDFAIHVANPADQEPAFNEVVQAFEAENPDIKINLIGKELDRNTSSQSRWNHSRVSYLICSGFLILPRKS